MRGNDGGPPGLNPRGHPENVAAAKQVKLSSASVCERPEIPEQRRRNTALQYQQQRAHARLRAAVKVAEQVGLDSGWLWPLVEAAEDLDYALDRGLLPLPTVRSGHAAGRDRA